MPETFSFTSNELQRVIETAVEKAVSKMRVKSCLGDKEKGKKKFVKIKEFAQEFNVTPEAVRKWILQGEIEAIRLARSDTWRIPVEEVENYKEKSRKQTKRDIFQRSF